MESKRPPQRLSAAAALILATWVVLFPAVRGSTGERKETFQRGSGSMDAYRRESEAIERKIEKQRQQVETAARRETDVLSQLDRLEREIREIRRNAAALATEISELDRQSASAEDASADLKSRIRANEGYVARRLVAWYKLNRLGEIQLLATADSLAAFLRRKAALESILAHDESVRRQMLRNQNELNEVLQQLAERRHAKQRKATEKQRQLTLLDQRRETRAALLADVRRRKDLQLAALEELQQAAGRLDRKMAVLNRESDGQAGNPAGASAPFSGRKGLLNMPVKGKITSSFGSYRNTAFNVTNFRSGIDIQTDKGEPVRAVHDGRILYASWFKGYGNMMIIDHGASYYTVYAHVEEMFKSIGDRVDGGDVIATAGDTGSMYGARLYFEVRHHGKPLDPMDWLK